MKFVKASARAFVRSSLQDQFTNFPTHWKVDFVNDTYDVFISTTDGISNVLPALWKDMFMRKLVPQIYR